MNDTEHGAIAGEQFSSNLNNADKEITSYDSIHIQIVGRSHHPVSLPMMVDAV